MQWTWFPSRKWTPIPQPSSPYPTQLWDNCWMINWELFGSGHGLLKVLPEETEEIHETPVTTVGPSSDSRVVPFVRTKRSLYPGLHTRLKCSSTAFSSLEHGCRVCYGKIFFKNVPLVFVKNGGRVNVYLALDVVATMNYWNQRDAWNFTSFARK